MIVPITLNKDPHGFYLTGLFAKMSHKCNLGQGFERSSWINIMNNAPAKLYLSLVAGPNTSAVQMKT